MQWTTPSNLGIKVYDWEKAVCRFLVTVKYKLFRPNVCIFQAFI